MARDSQRAERHRSKRGGIRMHKVRHAWPFRRRRSPPLPNGRANVYTPLLPPPWTRLGRSGWHSRVGSTRGSVAVPSNYRCVEKTERKKCRVTFSSRLTGIGKL